MELGKLETNLRGSSRQMTGQLNLYRATVSVRKHPSRLCPALTEVCVG